MRFRCCHCQGWIEVPPGAVPGLYRCSKCGGSLRVTEADVARARRAAQGHPEAAGLVGGALLGGAVLGPPGAVLGAIIGMLLGSEARKR